MANDFDASGGAFDVTVKGELAPVTEGGRNIPLAKLSPHTLSRDAVSAEERDVIKTRQVFETLGDPEE